MTQKFTLKILVVFILLSCGPNGIHRTIEGTVVSKTTGLPIRAAQLTLLGINNGNNGDVLATQFSDSLGRFRINFNRGWHDQFTLHVTADSSRHDSRNIVKRHEKVNFGI